MRTRLIRGLLRALAWLPLPLNHGLASILGWALAHTPNELRRISRINLRLCLPELSARERRRLLRRSLREAAKTAFEMGPLWFWPRQRIAGLMRAVHNDQRLDRLLASGRGVIVATPHLGSWEMAGHYGALRWRITSLYRPPRLPALESFIRQGREHLGARLVPTSPQGIRALVRTLREGRIAGILPDQDPGDEGGRFAPFFGIPANTMTLLPRLARRTGAPVFIAYVERLPWGRGYEIHFHEVPDSIRDPDEDRALATLNAAVERCVRALPEQYQWGYRRFRTRPPGKPDLYRR